MSIYALSIGRVVIIFSQLVFKEIVSHSLSNIPERVTILHDFSAGKDEESYWPRYGALHRGGDSILQQSDCVGMLCKQSKLDFDSLLRGAYNIKLMNYSNI